MDRREQILSRLLELAKRIDGVVFAGRNRRQISEESRPAIVIRDGDETTDISRQPPPTRGPELVEMRPEIVLILGSDATTVGSELNALRAKLIKAVLADNSLRELSGTDPQGGVRYRGCGPVEAEPGRYAEGELGVTFSIVYVLRAGELQ